LAFDQVVAGGVVVVVGGGETPGGRGIVEVSAWAWERRFEIEGGVKEEGGLGVRARVSDIVGCRIEEA
jgi:hypothetical protein